MTVIERFAAFAAQTGTGAGVPAEAMAEAKLCLLDWLGCAIAGGGEPPATLLRRALGCASPPRGAMHPLPSSATRPLPPRGGGSARAPGADRLAPDGAPADPRTAALVNGAASHTVEVDDIFSPGLYHPGVVTVPATLALAEACGADGARLLRAIVAGYEVGNRIARAVNPAHYAHWHTTATVGHFGAAAAAAAVLDLDARRSAHALATVATMAAGLRHAFSADAMSKPLHAGRAAEAGVLAALAAAEGVTGVLDMLEAPRGFGAAMAEAPDWDAATATLGAEWTISATTRKAHACCGHSFAALDAIGALVREHALAPADIAAIEVGGYRATVEICGNPAPGTAAEARFSLPFCAAAMAGAGAVTPAAFTEAALADRATRALAARVALALDDEAEAHFPGLRGAVVTIRTADGRALRQRRRTRRGDPADPLSAAEIAAKFHALADPVIGAPSARALAEAVGRIDRARDCTLPLAPDTAERA
jgi:2-methylcitrate dehydratase PrpD